ncbi:PTS transporter subunit EIIC [Salinicoccus kekensis]|uniref:PTS system IIA component (Glc family) /PTS system IIB component (Glc family) /PTS system IIC component (Glc family) n=1 Tax=Salinicoccus kekensis TaxID=714307 RepID=A0A285UIS9_9STAP|nr:PTS transporter subunit EIIC [Salinicoccus kekensis]SOC41683.1 PTS system IIA component (Glc family) /PTS system IIB component (Glc family) /PTS system IIC component (Glc family) [Salinicoccus kekensis]
MAKKDYKMLAENIIDLVGGPENIESVIHCVTRLRFYLKDKSKADTEEIKDLDGVMGVAEGSGQYQVVVGPAVDDIYKEVTALLPASGEGGPEKGAEFDASDPDTFYGRVKNNFNKFIGLITASVMPIINILAAAGIIKGLLAVMTSFNLVTDTGNAYLIINAMADAVFYFLPVLVGFNAAKRLGGNPLLTAVIGGVIIHPSILEAANAEASIFSLGTFNFPFIAYTYSIFPMILAAWLIKKLEDWLKTWVSSYIQAIFIPIVVIGVVSSITLIITGPVLVGLSSGLADGLETMLNANAPIFGFIINAFYQVLVIFGLHWGIIPVYVNDFATLGYSYLSAIVSMTIVGQAGAALAVAVKSKKAEIKEIGYAGAFSAFCGITEPAIYGINLRFRRPFICASLASAIGGLLTGLFGINMWSIIGSIIGLPSYIDPEQGITANFWYAVFVTFMTLFLAFIFTYIWGYNDSMVMEKKREKPKNPAKMDFSKK